MRKRSELQMIIKNYTDLNADVIDSWVDEGWEWSLPISHEDYIRATKGDWEMLLTPTKPVPKHWFCTLKGAKVLGLACGGGQQMPIFQALGAACVVLDYAQKQLDTEMMVANREGYTMEMVRADMTKSLPFADETFDLIFHPVSNCYIEEVQPVWLECFRVLKKGGILLAGLDNGINFAFDDDGKDLRYTLPYNPLKDQTLYQESIDSNSGMQFSHTIEEQIDGQLQAGFVLQGVYGDTNGTGRLHDHNLPTFYATKSIKP